MAARSGHSLNTWLVTVVRAATRDSAINVDIDLSSIPFLSGNDPLGGKRGTQADERLGLAPPTHRTTRLSGTGSRPASRTNTPSVRRAP